MGSPLPTIAVTGRYVDLANKPVNGYVLLTPVYQVVGQGWVVVGSTVTAYIRNGQLNTTIIADSDALSQDLYVRVTERLDCDRGDVSTYVVKPEGATLNLATAPRVGTAPTGTLFIPASMLGQPGGVATLGTDGKLTLSQRPPGGGGSGITLEEADARYARIVHTHTIADITGLAQALAGKASTAALGSLTDAVAQLDVEVDGKQNTDTALTQISALTPAQGDIIQYRGGQYVSRTLTELRADLGDLANIPGLKLYDVEAAEYGAVGDGVTDDYDAFRLAHQDMLSQGHLGAVFCPRIARYRLDLDVPGRLVVSPDKARAFFPYPMRSRAAGVEKAVYGIVGVGEPETERAAELGGTPTQVNTASAIIADYSGVFTWSPTEGLPCVFGGPDADMTDNTGNDFSNIHLVLRNVILRNSDNPSLTMVNAEQMSTCEVERVRIDVIPVLDQATLCTHPTGGSLLLPRSNNNPVVRLLRFIVVGHYTGVPLTEHLYADVVTALRCTIGCFTRRPNSHPLLVLKLLTEQCPWGIAGWNPSGEGPNLGVTDIHGLIGRIVEWGIEDYGYNGLRPEQYTPLATQRRTHVLNRLDQWGGQVGLVARINSEQEPPSGNGVPPTGQSSSLYVTGTGGNTTDTPRLALLAFNGIDAAQRLQGGVPANPTTAPPNAPTIGTATAGIESATIVFTPAATGPPATSFTATASPGGATATGAGSPLTITGLTAGQEYTITVHATNSVGNSPESAPSNAVTPTAPPISDPADTFNRPDAPQLGISTSGHAWLGDAEQTWTVSGNVAENIAATTAWNPAWMLGPSADMTVYADFLWNERESGLVGRVVDADHLYYLDLNWGGANTATGQVYLRNGTGSFSPLGNGYVVSAMVPGQIVRLKFVFSGNTINAYVNREPGVDHLVAAITDATVSGLGYGIASLTGPSHTIVGDFVTVATP